MAQRFINECCKQTFTNQFMKIQGKAIISEEEQKEALAELAKENREFLTRAIDKYLVLRYHMKVTKIVYRDGIVEAIIGGSDDEPSSPDNVVAEVTPVKKMSSGWSRDYVGLTRFLKEFFRDKRREGRKKIKIAELLEEVHDEFPKAKKKMDELRLGGYLRDQRHFKGVKYNSVNGEILF